MLGIEGGYTIASPATLWVARAAAVALAAVVLAAALHGRRPEDVAAGGSAAR